MQQGRGQREPGCSVGNRGALKGTKGAVVSGGEEEGCSRQESTQGRGAEGQPREACALVSTAAVTKCRGPGGSLQKRIPLLSWVLEVGNQGVARAISSAREPLGKDGRGAWLSDSGAAGDPWCHTPTGLHPHAAFSACVCLHKAFRRVPVSVPPLLMRTRSSRLGHLNDLPLVN